MAISNKKQISNTLIRKMLSCIKEYEAIKTKTSIQFRTVKSFCEHHRFSHQNFMKIYHRYKDTQDASMLLPHKEKIIRPKRILMDHSGELLNVDLHQLSKGITIHNSNHTYYLLGLVDGYSRVAWVEVLDSKKSLDVMFGFLKSFNLLRMEYGIESESVMTDNGSEFGGGAGTQDKEHHPFERLLLEGDKAQIHGAVSTPAEREGGAFLEDLERGFYRGFFV